MGSLIAALNNQNISAANAETLGDVYSANPANAGYTDNPFGYAASPAVIQTAYPKYGYNATAPQVPQSYEDYDLTSLFGMLQDIKKPQDDRLYPADPRGVTAGTQGDAGPMARPNLPPTKLTPGGILAEAAKVQQSKQPVQPAGPPVPGAYTVPGAPTAPADTTAEDKAAAQAAEDARIRSMIAEDAAARQKAELISRYNNVSRQFQGFADPNISRFSNSEIKNQMADMQQMYDQMLSE